MIAGSEDTWSLTYTGYLASIFSEGMPCIPPLPYAGYHVLACMTGHWGIAVQSHLAVPIAGAEDVPGLTDAEFIDSAYGVHNVPERGSHKEQKLHVSS